MAKNMEMTVATSNLLTFGSTNFSLSTNAKLPSISDEVEVISESTPYVQIVQPENAKTAEKVEASTWGLLIPAAEAEKAGYIGQLSQCQDVVVGVTPDEKEITVPGYLVQQGIRIVPLAMSPSEYHATNLADGKPGFRCFKFELTSEGRENYGSKTSEGLACQAEIDAMRATKATKFPYTLKKRLYFAFVDFDNQPLHEKPFVLSLRGATGVAFEIEMQEYHKSVVLAKQVLEGVKYPKKGTLAMSSWHNYSWHINELGWFRSQGTAPYVYPKNTVSCHPSFVGEHNRKGSNGRIHTVLGAGLENFAIDPESEAGCQLKAMSEVAINEATKYITEAKQTNQQTDQLESSPIDISREALVEEFVLAGVGHPEVLNSLVEVLGTTVSELTMDQMKQCRNWLKNPEYDEAGNPLLLELPDM